MQASKFRIRPFSAEDAPTVVDIYNQARPIEVAQLNEDRFWSWFNDPALNPCRDILVAEDAQGPVGLIAAFPWPNHLDEGYVFFVGPSVLPEFQSQGVGRQLVESLTAEVAERYPGKRLQTRLQQGNAQAHAFLTGALGFSVDRQFWLMTHSAPGQVRVSEAPEGYEFEFLQPGDDPSEAIEVYKRILDDPSAGHHLLDADELRGWAALKNFGENSFQVVRRGGHVVGLCFQAFPPATDFGQIQFLGVLPSERGHGVASHLLRLALKNAHTNGKHSVRLEVSGGDTVTQALYKRMGFEVAGGETFYQGPSTPAVQSQT